MKILQLGKFYPIQGGVEKVMYDLMSGFDKYYPDVCCDMMCVAADSQPYAQKLKQDSQSTLYCAKLNKKLFSTMLSSDLVIKLRKICNEYDIIHIHHPDPMAALALRLSGYNGHVILHWHSDILKQKLLLKFYRPLQEWLINRADIIIGTTPKYLEESPHLKPFSKRKSAVPIGIEDIKIDENKTAIIRELYKNKKIIFSLGRLVGYKGFEYLIDSAKYLSSDYIILIGGSGPLKEMLQGRIIQNNLSDKVKLLGRINDEDLPSYYGVCDIFVLSSIWKTEAFGIVQIEAMSCGKPVIATRIPESGVDWVNKDGYSGLNVNPEQPKQIAEAIKEILKDEVTYSRYAHNARKRFEDNFTISKMLSGCHKIYSEILSK